MHLICPICKTHNTEESDAQVCTQCKSDLYLHRLLLKTREEIQMNNEAAILLNPQNKAPGLLLGFSQIVSPIIFIMCAIFIFFIGVRFLTLIDREDTHRISISNKVSETGLQQLQQMNAIIKQELDLIQDQYRENQALQEKISQLNALVQEKMEKMALLSPLPSEENSEL